MSFDMSKINRVILINSEGKELEIHIGSVEKEDSIINEYHLHGHVGKELCSGADVGMIWRSLPKTCGKCCCDL